MARANLTGEKFNRWVAISPTNRKTKGGNYIWLCQCDCGNYGYVDTGSLKAGTSKSCGCYVRERMHKLNYKHGGRNDRLYLVWMDMRRRCNDPKGKEYKNYGGRGIKVCEEWENYENFKNWALSNGYDKNAKRCQCTLDRIETNGNYEPSNCRWADMVVQANNKRNNIIIEYKNERKTLAQWSKETGISYSVILRRLKNGWSTEDILTKPARKLKNKLA